MDSIWALRDADSFCAVIGLLPRRCVVVGIVHPSGSLDWSGIMALHLWQLGARDIAARVRSGEISARAVAESSLARVAQVNPALNALIGVDAEWTLAQADSVDQRLKAGQDLPLAGVPVTVKDNLWVQGRRITQGSKLFADFIAPDDAWVVSRLRALGR